jgi:hypothetical protein
MDSKDIIYVHGGPQIANQVEETTETHTGYWLRTATEIVCCRSYEAYIHRMRTHEKCTCGNIHPRFSICADCADRKRRERVKEMPIVPLQEDMSVCCDNEHIFSDANGLFNYVFFENETELNLRHCPKTEQDYADEIQCFFENEMMPIFTVEEKHPKIDIEEVLNSFYQEFNFENDIEYDITKKIYKSVETLNKHLQSHCVEVQGKERINTLDLSQAFIKWMPFDDFLERLRKEDMIINFEKDD